MGLFSVVLIDFVDLYLPFPCLRSRNAVCLAYNGSMRFKRWVSEEFVSYYLSGEFFRKSSKLVLASFFVHIDCKFSQLFNYLFQVCASSNIVFDQIRYYSGFKYYEFFVLGNSIISYLKKSGIATQFSTHKQP